MCAPCFVALVVFDAFGKPREHPAIAIMHTHTVNPKLPATAHQLPSQAGFTSCQLGTISTLFQHGLGLCASKHSSTAEPSRVTKYATEGVTETKQVLGCS